MACGTVIPGSRAGTLGGGGGALSVSNTFSLLQHRWHLPAKYTASGSDRWRRSSADVRSGRTNTGGHGVCECATQGGGASVWGAAAAQSESSDPNAARLWVPSALSQLVWLNCASAIQSLFFFGFVKLVLVWYKTWTSKPTAGAAGDPSRWRESAGE